MSGADTTRDDAALRMLLARILGRGLKTEWKPRAYTPEAIHDVIEQLRTVDPQDYEAKLAIAGFLMHHYRPDGYGEIEQGCSTCMYFERHNGFCDLPELAVPVEPNWWCRLWRI